jgi:hypothetical protein
MTQTNAVAVIEKYVAESWATSVVPILHEYIAIPALSPMFDPGWTESGHLVAATSLLKDWASSRSVSGLTVELHTPDPGDHL